MDSWDFQLPHGILSHGPLTGTVNLEYPQRGLHQIELAGAPIPELELLGIEPPGMPASEGESILDSYVRGRDLVATYAQSPARSVRPQCYWRAVDCNTSGQAAPGLELIVSMQTSLLESAPRASVVCRLPEGKTRRLVDESSGLFDDFVGGPATPENGSGLFLFLASGNRWRLATMVEPSDFLAAELAPAERELRYELFPHSLEKGVIRRARLLGVFLPADGNAEELALECYRQFLSSPMPLST